MLLTESALPEHVLRKCLEFSDVLELIVFPYLTETFSVKTYLFPLPRKLFKKGIPKTLYRWKENLMEK